jgi:hypothetical protein
LCRMVVKTFFGMDPWMLPRGATVPSPKPYIWCHLWMQGYTWIWPPGSILSPWMSRHRPFRDPPSCLIMQWGELCLPFRDSICAVSDLDVRGEEE